MNLQELANKLNTGLNETITKAMQDTGASHLISSQDAKIMTSTIQGYLSQTTPVVNKEHPEMLDRFVVIGAQYGDRAIKMKFIRRDNPALFQSAPIIQRYDIREVETPGIKTDIAQWLSSGVSGVSNDKIDKYLKTLFVIETAMFNFTVYLSNKGLLKNDNVIALLHKGTVHFRYGGLLISPGFRFSDTVKNAVELKNAIGEGNFSMGIRYTLDQQTSQDVKSDGKWINAEHDFGITY